jgi:curved DNA-binding protein
MATFKDYYKIMGLEPGASADDVRRAYRTLARKLHPDVNKAPDAMKRFTDLGEAYEALSDPEKRNAYDELRQGGYQEGDEMNPPPPPAGAWRSAGPRGGAGGAYGDAGPMDGGEGIDPQQFSEFFSRMFGDAGRRGGRRAHRERGEDIHHALPITLEEVYHGGERQLQMQLPPAPGDTGPVMRTLRVTIPKGLAVGEPIRLRGQGLPGDGPGQAGDLYLEIAYAPHARYRVDGRDVASDLRVAPWEAVLGAKVPAPTLGGTVTVAVPAGSQDGDKLRLKGRGLPGEPPGDHYLVLRIVVPPAADEQAKELWRRLAAATPFDPRRET